MSLQELFEQLNDYCEPDCGITFSWTSKDVGFGNFYFYTKNKRLYCDNELMSKDFVKKMLCKMVDDATFTEL